jgi:non-specific serine/threonine protein kinase
MLSGQLAFPARDPARAAYEALNHHPSPIHVVAPGLPEEMDWVIRIALAKQTAERYARAAEFARDLRAAAQRAVSHRVADRAASLLSAGSGANATRTSVT